MTFPFAWWSTVYGAPLSGPQGSDSSASYSACHLRSPVCSISQRNSHSSLLMLWIRGTKKNFYVNKAPVRQVLFHADWSYNGVQKMVVSKHTVKFPKGHSSFLGRGCDLWPPLSHGMGLSLGQPKWELTCFTCKPQGRKRGSAYPTNLGGCSGINADICTRTCPGVPQQACCCLWSLYFRHAMWAQTVRRDRCTCSTCIRWHWCFFLERHPLLSGFHHASCWCPFLGQGAQRIIRSNPFKHRPLCNQCVK